MEAHATRLVQYEIGNVDQEVMTLPSNFVERQLVVLAQDEMTA
jgi:hypothetical protein